MKHTNTTTGLERVASFLATFGYKYSFLKLFYWNIHKKIIKWCFLTWLSLITLVHLACGMCRANWIGDWWKLAGVGISPGLDRWNEAKVDLANFGQTSIAMDATLWRYFGQQQQHFDLVGACEIGRFTTRTVRSRASPCKGPIFTDLVQFVDWLISSEIGRSWILIGDFCAPATVVEYLSGERRIGKEQRSQFGDWFFEFEWNEVGVDRGERKWSVDEFHGRSFCVYWRIIFENWYLFVLNSNCYTFF